MERVRRIGVELTKVLRAANLVVAALENFGERSKTQNEKSSKFISV